jgi:hypothetical protein
VKCPHIHLVPKEQQANLRFREEMIRMGNEGAKEKSALLSMCAQDPLFYLNAFGWTYDPRLAVSTVPFITYPYQDDAILQVIECIEKGEDLLVAKSRDMGASWIILVTFEWMWRFRHGQSFLVVSRNEDYVDKAGNPKSLFWKFDFLHKNMPGWLLPNMTRTRLRMSNDDNGSSIDGESTTGDVARGDRRTAIMLDEFAAFESTDGYRALSATRDATRCRIFNSTPAGSSNAFYDLSQKQDIRQVRMHWSQHPVKADGMYTDASGKARSPWYDRECRRCANATEIAQELDIDFAGSDYLFFDASMIDRLVAQTGAPPYVRGELEFDPQTLEPTAFTEHGNGKLKLWIRPTLGLKLPEDRNYAIGVDIATGTGSSNSAIAIGDCLTGEKVGEYVNPKIRPDELGRLAVSLGRWFKGMQNEAYMVWEAPGPGRNFGDVVMQAGYRNVYYRKNELSITAKAGTVPGWWPTKDEKRALYGEYRRALNEGEFQNRSVDALRECKEIVYTDSGWVIHGRSLATPDPSGARENHGDRPTADALCWKGMRGKASQKTTDAEMLPGSLAWRRLMAQQRKSKKVEW